MGDCVCVCVCVCVCGVMVRRKSKGVGGINAEGLSYHERKHLGYGTAEERAGSDSVVDYDCCWLTLQPARDPVVTTEGYVYSREAILENLLAQKKAMRREEGRFEEDERRRSSSRQLQSEEKDAEYVKRFDKSNHAPLDATSAATTATGAREASAYEKHLERRTKAFWLPSEAPRAEQTVSKPKQDTLCPASNKRLRLKDLISIRFTPCSGRDAAGDATETARHMCPISMKTLTRASKLVVLRPTGDVITEEAYKKVVKPDGVYKGHKITSKDVIAIKNGGSSFAGSHATVQVRKFAHLGFSNGPADSRGQSRQGGQSAFGLRYTS